MYYNYQNNVPNYNQNRLNQLQQQYNQYQQIADNNFRNNQMPQQVQSPQQQSLLKGRAVTSIEEARSAIIDFDGNVNVFLDIANRKIYTKQINLDGTATLNTYKLDNTPIANETVSNSVDYVNKSEFEALKTEVDKYRSILEKILGGVEDVQSANVNANDDAR